MEEESMAGVTLSEMPRERLMRDGVEALSIQELVAILLGTGLAGKSVLILAQELVIRFGGLQGLLSASIEELKQVKGIGEAKAILLKAAFGLAMRAAKEGQEHHPHIQSPEEAFEIARMEIGHFKKEALLVLLRDIRGKVIHREIVAIGTLSEVLVHPREVFNPAVRHQAHSLILAHNHPSGDPTPSQKDIELTKHLLHSSRVMGIGLDDHLIVGKEKFYSMRRQGLFGSASTY